MTPKIYDPQAEVDGIRAMDARRTIREGAQALEKERTSGTGGFTMSVPNTPAPAAPPAAPLKVGVTGSSHGPNEAYYNGKKYNIGTSGDAQSAAKDAKGKAMRASAAKKQAASLTALEAQGGDWRQTLPPAQLVKEANLLHPKQTQQELVNDLLAGGYPGWDKMNVTKIKGPMYPEGKVPGSKAKAVRQREHIAHKKS
jgi:hypothetical protein